MDIGSNETVLLLYLLKTADIHVLTDDGDLGGQSLFYGHGRILFPFLFHKCIHICCAGVQSLGCNVSCVGLELLVLCHEVCLSVYLYNYCALLVCGKGCNNDTLCCDTASLLSCACKSFFT